MSLAMPPLPPRFVGRRGDFDFLVGRWRVANRRLRERLAGCEQWDEFVGDAQAEVRHDGAISVDEIRFPSLGAAGFTLRTLDHAAERWAIYWISSGSGRLEPPVWGGFDGDRGCFVGLDTHAGRPVQVRFDWTRGADAAHWSQAFSADGDTWETNWHMAFTRLG